MAKRTCINILSLLALIAVSLSFTSCNKVSEKELVGIWFSEEEYLNEDGTTDSAESALQFLEGGNFLYWVEEYDRDHNLMATVNVKGEYEIKGKEINYTVKDADIIIAIIEGYESEFPDEAQINKECLESLSKSDEIISFTKAKEGSDDSDELVLKDGDGEITPYYRE